MMDLRQVEHNRFFVDPVNHKHGGSTMKNKVIAVFFSFTLDYFKKG